MPRPADPSLAPATLSVAPGGALVGRCAVPDDKSISQRAALLGALADGETRIAGFLRAADPLALLGALAACGVAHRFETGAAGEPELVARGRALWRSPAAALDLGNSGTALRLLAGAIAGHPIAATLTGDGSRCGRWSASPRRCARWARPRPPPTARRRSPCAARGRCAASIGPR